MFGFNVQIEKPMFNNAGKVCPDGALADAADASEEYTHAESSMRVMPLLEIIRDSCRRALGCPQVSGDIADNHEIGHHVRESERPIPCR
jgi:hypothetical protein